MWGHAQDAIDRGSQGIQEQSRLRSSYLQRRRDLDLLVRGSTEAREASAKRWDSFYHVSVQIIFLFSSYTQLEMMRAKKKTDLSYRYENIMDGLDRLDPKRQYF